MQRAIAQFFLESPSLWIAAVKYVLLLFPAALWVVAVWCTQGALYTLPFRGRRQAFVSTMLLMWWDAVRAAWLYWMGVLRLAVVLVGWSAMFVSLGMKLMARGAVRLAGLPVTASKRLAKHHSRPGVPWIAARTGGRYELGAWLTVAIPLAGWISVRSMTWFLFAQFGTPALPAHLGRRPAIEPNGRPITVPPTSGGGGWRAELDELGRGMGWLHEKSDELLEYLALPVLTVLAVALNFGMVLVTSRPAFSVPFKGLKAVPDTGDILAAMAPPPRKGVSA